MRLDAIAIPCRVCLASPGRYCYVMIGGGLGACMDSILPSPHDMRVNDAAVVARILAGGKALDARIVVACADTWSDDAPGAACCEHGYMYGCPSGHEPIPGVETGTGTRTGIGRLSTRRAKASR